MAKKQEYFDLGFDPINIALTLRFVDDNKRLEYKQVCEEALNGLKNEENTEGNKRKKILCSFVLDNIEKINKEHQEYLEKRAREQKLKKLTIEIKPKTDKGKILLDELLREGIDFEYCHQD